MEAGSYVAPRSEDEAILASLWAEVLGRPAVGVEDDFYELGANSLHMTQVWSRAQRSFGELPLARWLSGRQAQQEHPGQRLRGSRALQPGLLRPQGAEVGSSSFIPPVGSGPARR